MELKDKNRSYENRLVLFSTKDFMGRLFICFFNKAFISLLNNMGFILCSIKSLNW